MKIKKIPALALAAAIFLCSCGCSSMLNAEYESVSKHVESAPVISDQSVPGVSSLDELEDAILNMIKSRLTTAKLRFEDYNGDPETDTAVACAEVANETPLGAYAVYYISGSVNKNISYHQAEITIIYKKTLKQINSIVYGATTDIIDEKLKTAMTELTDSLAIRTSLGGVDSTYFEQSARRIAFKSGSDIFIIPTVSAHFYPDAAADHIADVSLTYPLPYERLYRMRTDLDTAISGDARLIDEPSEAKTLVAIFERLSDRVERVLPNDAASIDDTAYGAYVNGKASPLGVALAFKLACNKNGLECHVVDGRFGGADHYWNIVKIDGSYYNCDVYRAVEAGISDCIFRSDADFELEYWHDSGAYPECSGELTYSSVTGDAAE